MLPTYSHTFQISSYDLNPNASSRLTSLANFLQEMAYQHAKRLKWGFHDLEKDNTAWVLSRFSIKIHKFPGWDDIITIDTWPRGVDRLFGLRDFKIVDEKGIHIADATTSWLMVDIETHRPKRLTKDIMELETRTDTAFGSESTKIELSDHSLEAHKRTVKYADLDIVGHVNNVRYMEWCLDAIPLETHMAHTLATFEINFLGEAKYGDEIQLNISEGEHNIFIINALHTKTLKECVRAKVSFR